LTKIPLFDLAYENEALSEELTLAFRRVVKNSSFILGTEVSNFERHVESYLGTGHAVGLSNGSDALYVALKALGIGPGCEVITSPFTFVSTAEAIVRCGAVPVFADIDPNTFGLCPASTARMRTNATRAVLTVHLYGHPGTVLELSDYCTREGLWFVEDACQAFGAKIQSRPVGTIGDVGVFSFFPTKPLGGFGDGGLVITKNEALAQTIKSLRSHGLVSPNRYETLSGNFRLDALQAALLDVKLAQVDCARKARRVIAERYHSALANCDFFRVPSLVPETTESAWSLYTIRVPNRRDPLLKYLATNQIEARAYYPSLLSEQPLFSGCSRSDKLVHATAACKEVVSLPMYLGLTTEAQHRVIDALLSFAPNA
jgi:dTDP-4-amino-4,6-dideoxygalactose transaminase